MAPRKNLGYAYFLDSIFKHLIATEEQIEPHKLETNWPAIRDQLGREKFRSDVSQLSAKELELISSGRLFGRRRRFCRRRKRQIPKGILRAAG